MYILICYKYIFITNKKVVKILISEYLLKKKNVFTLKKFANNQPALHVIP